MGEVLGDRYDFDPGQLTIGLEQPIQLAEDERLTEWAQEMLEGGR